MRIKPVSRVHIPLSTALDKRAIRLFFSHFPDGVRPNWHEKTKGAVVADDLEDPEKRWASLESCLDHARKAGADMVVFPELTICPRLRRKVSTWLEDHPHNPFSLVLPGSFHERRKNRTYNTAELMSRSGKTVLTHIKLAAFGLLNKREGIDTGARIDLLDTPIGLIGIPICLDFCQEGQPFGGLWDAIGAEWLLVPAFGDKKSVRAHERRAEAVCRAHNTVCVLANQNPEGKDADLGFVSAPDGKTPGRKGPGTCVDVSFLKKG